MDAVEKAVDFVVGLVTREAADHADDVRLGHPAGDHAHQVGRLVLVHGNPIAVATDRMVT